MLPEVLSNGVCSLQEGRTRLAKSAFIRFSPEGQVLGADLANSFIKSAKRLTYEQASDALEGKTGGLAPEIVELLKRMERLARILLGSPPQRGVSGTHLPEVELEFNDDGHVVAAHPEDTSFSHRIIEMFMVEANEAVARALQDAGMVFMRRIHPRPTTRPPRTSSITPRASATNSSTRATGTNCSGSWPPCAASPRNTASTWRS